MGMSSPAASGTFPCKVKERNDVPEGTVDIPERSRWWEYYPDATHARIAISEAYTILRVRRRPHASGNTVSILPGTVNGVINGTADGVLTPASARSARRYWVRHARDGQFAFMGLMLAITGEAVKISLKIGSVSPLINVGSSGVAALEIVAFTCTVAGLVLIFWKGVLSAS